MIHDWRVSDGSEWITIGHRSRRSWIKGARANYVSNNKKMLQIGVPFQFKWTFFTDTKCDQLTCQPQWGGTQVRNALDRRDFPRERWPDRVLAWRVLTATLTGRSSRCHLAYNTICKLEVDNRLDLPLALRWTHKHWVLRAHYIQQVRPLQLQSIRWQSGSKGLTKQPWDQELCDTLDGQVGQWVLQVYFEQTGLVTS